MKNPAPTTLLALKLSTLPAGTMDLRRCAWDATRVVAIAIAVRRLVEASCNVELTSRQEKRLGSLRKRAAALLQPYGMELANPWGLCHYACPIGHDGRSESSCIFLA
jgi:hypothetical protein